MSKELLEEIIEQIREALPEGTDVGAWIDDVDKFSGDTTRRSSDLSYQYGRLLGAAEWTDSTVLELLDDFDISLEEPQSSCPLYSTLCTQHDFVHGAEAEELRKGIEELLSFHGPDPVDGDLLQRLLDKVAARDSLAYLEAQDCTVLSKCCDASMHNDEDDGKLYCDACGMFYTDNQPGATK